VKKKPPEGVTGGKVPSQREPITRGVINLDISTVRQDAQQHPAAASMYVRHGWKLCMIPFGQKGPTTPNWNQPDNWITDTTALPPTFNMGLLHAYSGTMALDIDNFEQSRMLLAEVGIDLDQLFAAPDAVTIDSGKQGHGKLLYAMPFGLVLPSKKLQINRQVVLDSTPPNPAVNHTTPATPVSTRSAARSRYLIPHAPVTSGATLVWVCIASDYRPAT